MIGNAQVLYAEIIQLGDVAKKYRRNCDFWQLMLDALKEEKPLFLNSMWEYRGKERDIRKRIKRNRKAYNKAKKRILLLQYKYKHTMKRKEDYDE